MRERSIGLEVREIHGHEEHARHHRERGAADQQRHLETSSSHEFCPLMKARR
jgi:hypothetical protein